MHAFLKIPETSLKIHNVKAGRNLQESHYASPSSKGETRVFHKPPINYEQKEDKYKNEKHLNEVVSDTLQGQKIIVMEFLQIK